MKEYLRDIARTPLVPRERERELGERVAAGDPEARDELIRANLRLVVHSALKMRRRDDSLADLVAQGNLGLIRAVECFDPAKGFRFYTYARHWICQAIKAEQRYGNDPIPVPAYMHVLLVRYAGTGRLLAQRRRPECGRRPTSDEIMDAARIPQPHRESLAKAITRPRVESEPWTGGDGTQLDETAEAHEEPADERADSAIMAEAVRECVDKLEGRLRTIVCLRFGLDGKEPMTLRQVGTCLGLTPEWVRRLESVALEKLRECLVA